MFIVIKTYLCHLAKRPLHFVVWCGLLVGTTYGHAEQSQSDKVAAAIDQVKQGNVEMYLLEQIAEARAVQAVPILKEQFVRSQDVFKKAKIASVLVRLGDKDDSYWDYLVKQATPAAESDAPDLVTYDSHGKPVPDKISPQFVAWAKAHNVSTDSAATTMGFEFPVQLGIIAETGDPRGIPLLRQALRSSNYLNVAIAASGLAELRDKDSIALIIAACERAPADAKISIATNLVYFDDPRAQSAADTYLPEATAKALRDARRLRGSTPFHY